MSAIINQWNYHSLCVFLILCVNNEQQIIYLKLYRKSVELFMLSINLACLTKSAHWLHFFLILRVFVNGVNFFSDGMDESYPQLETHLRGLRKEVVED